MKIVFMGTPDFAVESLERLVKEGHEVVLVVTQPDKQKGRGKEMSMSPVKECAIKYDIPVFQPVKIREAENVSYLKQFEADIYVVAAFGQILSEEILNIPKFGCINIHASLLPKYRGAAPIQWAILDGEEYTGVTIQQMEKGLDTGDIISTKTYKIKDTDTGESLFDTLMYLGADLLIETLPLIEAGKINKVSQDESKSTYASKITKDMGKIDWSNTSAHIERYVRGLNSWPSAYTFLNGKTLKIWQSRVSANDDETNSKAVAGTVIKVSKDSIVVKTGDGALVISELQLEGKKRMSVHDFLLGYKMNVNDVLGEYGN